MEIIILQHVSMQINILYTLNLHNVIVNYTSIKLEGEKNHSNVSTVSPILFSIAVSLSLPKLFSLQTNCLELNSSLSSLTILCQISLPVDFIKASHLLRKRFGPQHHFYPALSSPYGFSSALLPPRRAECLLQFSCGWTSTRPCLQYSIVRSHFNSFILEVF